MLCKAPLTKSLILALLLLFAAGLPSKAEAAGDALLPPTQVWSFSGPFGTFDKAALQRGFQVYREVCSTCHGIDLVAFRNLADLGYSEEEIKALAAEYSVIDGPNDDGEMFERPATPADLIPPPFPNPQAAAAALGGTVAPELSLMAKARFRGPDYIYALLTGYEDPPAGMELDPGVYYNPYMGGGQISMAPPLIAEGVTYEDGTTASIEQMARDVSSFLMWTAEPKLEVRKKMGVKVVIFLLIFTAVVYAAKRKIWSDVH